MKVLIACEESQEVCKAFRELGHEVYSCDILPCSGGHPEWHIQDDVLKVIAQEHWDLMIAHPPCTFLSRAGTRWLFPKHKLNKERYKKGIKGKEFFLKLLNAPIPRLPNLNSTNVVKPEYYICNKGWRHSKFTANWNAKKKSKTFTGIARAMANQWGSFVKQELNFLGERKWNNMN